MNAGEHVCGSTKKQKSRKKTWWWNEAVNSAIKENRRCWKTRKNAASKEEYQKTKRLAEHAVYVAKSQAKQEVLNDPTPGSTDLFRLANQVRRKTWMSKARNLYAKMLQSDGVEGAGSNDDRIKQASWNEIYPPPLHLSGRSTGYALFIVNQLQEMLSSMPSKRHYMASVYLEKTFDRIPRRVVWWVLRKLDVDEWLVRLIHSMYEFWKPSPKGVVQDVPGKTCMQMSWSSSLNRLLEEMQDKLILWKTSMEAKGLRFNMGKTKVLISGPPLDVLQKSGKDHCGVCLKGVGKTPLSVVVVPVGSTRNAVVSLAWLSEAWNTSFRCEQCTGQARPIDGRLMTQVTVGRE